MVPLLDKEKHREAPVHQNNEIAYRYNQMNINLNKLTLNEAQPFIDLNGKVAEPNPSLLKEFKLGEFETFRDLLNSIYEQYQNILDSEQDQSSKYLIINNLISPV